MKHFEYNIDEKLQSIALRSIRTKRDLLLLLAYTVKTIIEQELLKSVGYEIEINDNHKLMVHVDKMNRVIYCFDDKIFSYQMPFIIIDENDGKSTIKFNQELVIDSLISSVMITIFEDEYCLDGTIVDVYERIDSLIKNNYDNIGYIEDEVWKMLKCLMIYEPGYIRYDDDPNPGRVDEKKHPRYHLDVNYETPSTYKIGLKEKVSPREILSVIDNNSVCAVLHLD